MVPRVLGSKMSFHNALNGFKIRDGATIRTTVRIRSVCGQNKLDQRRVHVQTILRLLLLLSNRTWVQ